MAGEVVGKIDTMSGAGNVLIVRASGESIIAKVGDEVFAGDTVVTSSGTTVLIRMQISGVAGVVTLDSALQAKFDGLLLDNISGSIVGSVQSSPLEVGENPSAEMVGQFNQVFPDGGIVTADESSQTETVIDLEDLDPSGASPDVGSEFVGNPLLANSPIITFEGDRSEKIPGKSSQRYDSQDRSFSFENLASSTFLSPEIFEFELELDVKPSESPELPEPLEITLIPFELVDDFVSTPEDTILRIDVLSNDLIGGVSVSDLGGHQGAITVAGTGGSGAGAGSDTGADTGTDTGTDTDTGTGADTGTGTGTGAPELEEAFLGEPLGGTYVAYSASGAAPVEVELPGGLLVSMILLNNGFSKNGVEVELNSDGTFTYKPPKDSTESDEFYYRVTLPEPDGREFDGTVYIDVGAVSDTTEFGSEYSNTGSTETIDQFTIDSFDSGGDVINLADLLQGEEGGGSLLSNYLTVSDAGDGQDVTITVDADQDGSIDLTIVLSGAGTGLIDLETLTSNGQIVVDT
jgi:hypothetical protein